MWMLMYAAAVEWLNEKGFPSQKNHVSSMSADHVTLGRVKIRTWYFHVEVAE